MLGLLASLERRLALCLNLGTDVASPQLSQHNADQFAAELNQLLPNLLLDLVDRLPVMSGRKCDVVQLLADPVDGIRVDMNIGRSGHDDWLPGVCGSSF